MPKRKIPIEPGEVYHIYIRSIAKFTIFTNIMEYKRILDLLNYYSLNEQQCCFSSFTRLTHATRTRIYDDLIRHGRRAAIIAYCIMPTHLHLIAEETTENGITSMMMRILDAYSRYFNLTHKRKGPLWDNRFQNVHVRSTEQLMHLTRYIHLNPATAKLVHCPQNWPHSSYLRYLEFDHLYPDSKNDPGTFLDIPKIHNRLGDTGILKDHKSFVNDLKDYRQNLYKIKHLFVE